MCRCYFCLCQCVTVCLWFNWFILFRGICLYFRSYCGFNHFYFSCLLNSHFISRKRVWKVTKNCKLSKSCAGLPMGRVVIIGRLNRVVDIQFWSRRVSRRVVSDCFRRVGTLSHSVTNPLWSSQTLIEWLCLISVALAPFPFFLLRSWSLSILLLSSLCQD